MKDILFYYSQVIQLNIHIDKKDQGQLRHFNVKWPDELRFYSWVSQSVDLKRISNQLLSQTSNPMIYLSQDYSHNFLIILKWNANKLYLNFQ